MSFSAFFLSIFSILDLALKTRENLRPESKIQNESTNLKKNQVWSFLLFGLNRWIWWGSKLGYLGELDKIYIL